MIFKQIQWLAVFLGIVSIEAALLYKLIASQAPGSQTELIIAICIVALVLMLSSNIDSLRSISVGKEGFRAELERLEEKIDRAIADLMILSMGKETFTNLKKLAYGEFKEFEPPHRGLETELYYLRNLGYVERTDKARSIHEIPVSGPDLSVYIQVTEKGRKYIELRDKRELKG